MITPAPRTFDAADEIDDLDEALTHCNDTTMGCPEAKHLAVPFDKLIAQLDGHRATRRSLERALSALEKQRKFLDDRLNAILDIVRTIFEPLLRKTKDREPPPEWAVKMFADCFAGEKPADARKHTLGPQVEIQRFWEKKLANAPIPALVQAGIDNSPIIVAADTLAAQIATAEAALDQFVTGPWADFVGACNAAFQLLFGQIGDLVHAPPAGVTFPPGFLDRFFLRESAPRPMNVSELLKAIPRAQARVAKLQAMLEEKQAKQRNDKRAKLLKEAAEAQEQVSAFKQQTDDAANRLAELQAELAKLTPPEPPPDKPNG
jgi:hypothetical protein